MATKNKIEVTIGAKDQTKTGVASAEKRLQNFSKNMANVGVKVAAAGAAMAGSLALILKQSAAMGDELQKASIRTGATVEQLSRLGHAATISGADLGALKVGIRRLGANMRDARDGLLASVETFDELGVSATDSAGNLRPLIDVFLDIADATSKMEDTTLAGALAQRALGRSGDLLLPLLFEGREGIQRLSDESDRLGITWTRLESDQAANLVDAMSRIKGSMSGISREILSALEPAIVRLAEELTTLLPKFTKWVDKHPEAVLNIGKLTAAIVGAGGFLIGLAAISTGLALAVKGFAALELGILAVKVALVGVSLGPIAALAGVLIGITAAVMAAEKLSAKIAAERGGERKRNVGSSGLVGSFGKSGGLGTSLGISAPQLERKGLLKRVGTGELPAGFFPQLPPGYKPQPAAATAQPPAGAPTEASEMDPLASSAMLGIGAPGGGQAQLGLGAPQLGPTLQMTEELGFSIGNAVTLTDDLEAHFMDLGTTSEGVAGAMVGHLAGLGDAIGYTFADALVSGQIKLEAFGQMFKQVFAGIIAQIIAAVAKLLIFKALFSIIGGGPAGGLSLGKMLGFSRGGLVPSFAGGGIVTGGVPGRDSVLAAVSPGELVIPKQVTDQLLQGNQLTAPAPVVIQAGAFMGDVTQAREFAQMVQDEQRFLTTGRRF